MKTKADCGLRRHYVSFIMNANIQKQTRLISLQTLADILANPHMVERLKAHHDASAMCWKGCVEGCWGS
jgi:mannitol/fructose-specific phosphotransferase system IIA component (Ntr-type)